MRIYVAGATGAIGRRLVPALVAAGHQVTGMTRSPAKREFLESAGARAVVADALDQQAVRDSVVSSRPDVVVHELTALASMRGLKNFQREFAATNRLRTEGTQYLLAAAQEAGAARFVAQSFTGWTNDTSGAPVTTEEDPFNAHLPAELTGTLSAIRQLEEMVTHSAVATGVVLRYGFFYGPGTSLGEGGEYLKLIRRRRFPLLGSGAGIWSFIHIDDAVSATRLAIERAPAGIYNIVDNDPAEVAVWLPELANVLGAKPPLHFPAWVGRLAVGALGLLLMNEAHGAANAKARRVLGWEPMYPSWRQGFRHGLAESVSVQSRP
jgi:2-alkyl-3-oxoalkanoate reductase